MNCITLIIESRIENVAIASACTKTFASDYFSNEAIAQMDNAIAETINNCIEHAYIGAVDQAITLHFALADDHLSVEIIDNGEMMPDPTLLDNISNDIDFDPLDIDQLPEGGFGLKIIKGCVDEFSYQRINHRNHWYLKKYRAH